MIASRKTGGQSAVRWGILGCGRIAKTLAGAIKSVEGAELVGVASRSVDKARAFAAEVGAPQSFGDYASLAASSDVDVVYVATPPSHHLDDSLLCLSHGKHLLCEKPFALNGDEARRIADFAASKGLFAMEAMWTRFLPAVRHFERLLRDGRIGAPRVMIAGGAFQPPVDPDYYLFNRALGGGVMNDAGVYLLHLAHAFLGPASRIQVEGRMGETGVDIQDGVLLGYPNGAMAQLFVSMEASQSPYLELLGDAGRLKLHPPVFNPSAVDLVERGGKSESWTFASNASGYAHQIEEVVGCLRLGLTQSRLLPLSDTVAVTDLLGRINALRDTAL